MGDGIEYLAGRRFLERARPSKPPGPGLSTADPRVVPRRGARPLFDMLLVMPMGYYELYVQSPFALENAYRTMRPDDAPLPTYKSAKSLLPEPIWDGHESAIRCHDKAWQIAFANLRRPTKESGFVARYIDTAFNDNLFMWDSGFIALFTRYGCRAFEFQRTLDNLYAKQHKDGFICREIREKDGSDTHMRFEPSGTGPNVLPWVEWEYFEVFGDTERLARVFPVLFAFHDWMRRYRSWPDGSYWATGWASGMDNQPRLPEGYHEAWHHGFMSWADACFQQILSARHLLCMAAVLGRERDAAPLAHEVARLSGYVNDVLWDPKTRFYYDRFGDGALNYVKSIGAYWALLADVVPADRLEAFVAHLSDERTFKRPHRVPTLAKDHPAYRADGGYWLGSVWAPTNYMVLRGLTRQGKDDLAYEIARNHLDNVVTVFEKTGTVWENYAPEAAAPGDPAKGDFVGWTGLPPIAVLYEYVLGIRADVPRSRVVWDVRLLERHGITRLPFGRDGVLDLVCEARRDPKDRPVVRITTSVPVELELCWAGGRETMAVPA
jgi:hypothetical protein